MYFKRVVFVFTFIFLFINGYALKAQDKANPDPKRFEKEIGHFVQYDQKNSFPEHAILFLGSSSIRMWKTHEAFPEFPVINRGFGGSHLSDVLYYYDKILKPYHPAVVVFYEGDNDIAYGKTAEQVFNDYKVFVTRLLKDFPRVKLIYLPVKPSVLRWQKWPEMQRLNLKIKEYNARHPQLFYADLTRVILNKEGKPNPGLFIQDGLHLNANGYVRWNNALRPLLQKVYRYSQH